MNPTRKRTTKRMEQRARLKLAKLKKARVEVQPPFYYKVPQYEEVFADRYYKYIILKGGRGSGKSFGAACFLIEESFKPEFKNKLFIFAREIQTSIEDSVFALVKSLIEQAFLNEYFTVKQNKIINKLTGVEFAFIGLRATGGKTAFSQVNKIKGKFGVAYIMVDESQDLTQDTIDVLFPTINRGSSVSIIPKPHHKKKSNDDLTQSRFIFCMNPNFENDPIVAKVQNLINDSLNKSEQPRGIILHVNIFDIPAEFQDAQLLEQAAAEKKEIYYDHVWLGAASHKISGYPWAALKEVRTTAKIQCYAAFLDPSFKGGDYTAISFMGMLEGELCVWGYAIKQAWNKTIEAVTALLKEYEPDHFWYEDNSLGSVPQDIFAEQGIRANPHTTLGNKENRIYKVASYTAHRAHLITNRCNTEYVNGVVKYNEESDHDDAPDSLASVLIKSGIITEKMKF